MEIFLSELETYMYDIVEVCTSLLEFFGIVVLVTSAVRAFIRWVRRDRQNIRLDLAQGIALALEFKMGGAPRDADLPDSLGDQEREEGYGGKYDLCRCERGVNRDTREAMDHTVWESERDFTEYRFAQVSS